MPEVSPTIDIAGETGFAAAVTGLTSTDAFLVAPSVTGAAYVSGGVNTGTLTLTDVTGAVVQMIHVSGSLDGNSFVVLPDAYSTYRTAAATEVVLVNGALQVGAPPAAPAGSATGPELRLGDRPGRRLERPRQLGQHDRPRQPRHSGARCDPWRFSCHQRRGQCRRRDRPHRRRAFGASSASEH